MPTYLLTWNPEQSPDDEPVLNRYAADLASGAAVRGRWSAGNTQGIHIGDRVFLLRQGKSKPGIIGAGRIVKGSHAGPHRDPAKRRAGKTGVFVQVAWDSVRPANELPRSLLIKDKILPETLLKVASSGVSIPQELCARLEDCWSSRLVEKTSRPSVSAQTFLRQFERFTTQVRDSSKGESFTSFRDGLPAEWEDYKAEVRVEALRRLNYRGWKQADVGTGKILAKLIQAIEIHDSARHLRNNLVAWQNRYGLKDCSHVALLKAEKDPQDRRLFDRWLYDFFHDRMQDSEAFEKFCGLAGKRYDLVAYLFFLRDWNRFMPIAPTTFDKAFKVLGIDLVTTRNCCWENYARYNAVLLEVRKSLRDIAELSDTRLIDAHSFCWMLVRLALPNAAPIQSIPLPEFIGDIRPTPHHRSAPAPPATFVVITDEEFAERDSRRRRLGLLAQDLVLQSEQRRLRDLGHPFPEQVVIPVWNEPGRGYDILSCEMDGSPRYIEAKAARHSGGNISFRLTANEQYYSATLSNYFFYLAFDVESANPRVLVVSGKSIPPECLKPTDYVASLVGLHSAISRPFPRPTSPV